MPITSLEPHALTLKIDFGSLEFVDTSTLVEQSLNWIGQERAKQAAYFGLQMDHSDYNLFVLGETGSGRSSLLQQAIVEIAANKSIPPDLCYVYNFDSPHQPLTLQLPAGKGNWLQQQLAQLINNLLQTTAKQQNNSNCRINAEYIKNFLEGLAQTFPNDTKLKNYLENIQHDLLDNLDKFLSADIHASKNQEALKVLCKRYCINVIVDNKNLTSAPVVIENNPSLKSLFGDIGYQLTNGTLITDFTYIQAGSLLKAQGGFLTLHLDDLLADSHTWEKFCRMLRSRTLQIEEICSINTATPAQSIEPESVTIDIKIILIGSREQYYAIQEENPELAQRFRVKVDFAASCLANIQTYQSLAIFIARLCKQLCLPHFSHAAVTRVLKICHRMVEDQKRLTTNFSYVEMLTVESAHQCLIQKNGAIVTEENVKNAYQTRTERHNYPERYTQETIADGDTVITVHGEKIGQINGLSLIEMGDYSFGIPARITAHTFAGEDGLLNIEREVGMSGPVHDKGVFILQNFLSALFHHNAPLALNASIVFEQEYYGIEGDSASCAELYALLSALSGLPFRQGIAVTGAINQFGEMLPVGGINEKIEGFFQVCQTAGFDGTQGVIIPHRNQRNLLLNDEVIHAVSKGMFHIYTINHMYDGLELLSSLPAGINDDSEFREIVNYPWNTVLGHAQKTLRAYRAACQQPSQPAKTPSKQR